MSWLIYKRGKIEPFRAAIPLMAIFKFQKHANGAIQPRTFYANTGEVLRWNWEEETFNRYWLKLVDFWRSPVKVNKHFKEMAAQTAGAIKAADKVIVSRLDKASNGKLIKIHASLLKDAGGEQKDLRGTVANVGTASGPVKIIKHVKDLKNFNQGDILVASMTRPEFMSAIKKAAAIVTDEGGVTCHAAIIARELNIPTVIGTKIATQILHDGDLVEVRANHGLVRILK